MSYAMPRFIKRYNGKGVEDWHSAMSKDARKCLLYLKRCLKADLGLFEVELEDFTINHYDVYGYAGKDGKHVFFSWSLPRMEYPIDCKASDPLSGVLYRTAKDVHDCHGGSNQFTNIEQCARDIAALLA